MATSTTAIFMKISSSPNSSGEYIRPKNTIAPKPIAWAASEPLNSLPAFFKKSDLMIFNVAKENYSVRLMKKEI